jgi:hypothetical protein
VIQSIVRVAPEAVPTGIDPDMRLSGVDRLANQRTHDSVASRPHPAYASLALGKAGLRTAVTLLHKELREDGVHATSVTIHGAVASDTPLVPELIVSPTGPCTGSRATSGPTRCTSRASKESPLLKATRRETGPDRFSHLGIAHAQRHERSVRGEAAGGGRGDDAGQPVRRRSSRTEPAQDDQCSRGMSRRVAARAPAANMGCRKLSP